MNTRRVGTITAGATGNHTLTWTANPSREIDFCHVQIFQTGAGGNTFTSTVQASIDPSRTNEATVTSSLNGNGIHEAVILAPYMKITVNVTVLGAGTFDVWVAE